MVTLYRAAHFAASRESITPICQKQRNVWMVQHCKLRWNTWNWKWKNCNASVAQKYKLINAYKIHENLKRQCIAEVGCHIFQQCQV